MTDFLDPEGDDVVRRSPIARITRRVRGRTFEEGLAKVAPSTLKALGIDLRTAEIGERIRRARQARGMTQADLAGKTGCRQNDISDLERGLGRDGPSYRRLRAIAEALEIALPINPQAEPMVGGRLILMDRFEGATMATFPSQAGQFPALLSFDDWKQVRTFVEDEVDDAYILPGREEFVVVTLEPHSQAHFTLPEANTVLTTVQGEADWTFEDNVQSRGARHDGKIVALTESGSHVGVSSGEAVVSFIVTSAAAVLSEDRLDEVSA